MKLAGSMCNAGFYDTDLEWVGLENVQIVSSMNPSTTLGRHELSTRFASVVRILNTDYTDREQLQVSCPRHLRKVPCDHARLCRTCTAAS